MTCLSKKHVLSNSPPKRNKCFHYNSNKGLNILHCLFPWLNIFSDHLLLSSTFLSSKSFIHALYITLWHNKMNLAFRVSCALLGTVQGCHLAYLPHFALHTNIVYTQPNGNTQPSLSCRQLPCLALACSPFQPVKPASVLVPGMRINKGAVLRPLIWAFHLLFQVDYLHLDLVFLQSIKNFSKQSSNNRLS